MQKSRLLEKKLVEVKAGHVAKQDSEMLLAACVLIQSKGHRSRADCDPGHADYFDDGVSPRLS